MSARKMTSKTICLNLNLNLHRCMSLLCMHLCRVCKFSSFTDFMFILAGVGATACQSDTTVEQFLAYVVRAFFHPVQDIIKAGQVTILDAHLDVTTFIHPSNQFVDLIIRKLFGWHIKVPVEYY